jgi:hypothetical protein
MKRIVWLLADGRKKYSSLHGKPEAWSLREIESLTEIIKESGNPGYAYGLTVFSTSVIKADDIIEIIGFETEDYNLPLTEGILN